MGFGLGKLLKKAFVPIRDTLETAATLAGNYYLPGSAMLTSNLVSKGSQDQLNSPIGKIAQIGTGLTGSGIGTDFTGIPSAADVGGGWTNAANRFGNTVGLGDIGTSATKALTSGIDSITSGLSDAASSVGNATGLSDLLRGSGSTGLDAADTAFLNKASIASQGFSPGETALLSSARAGLSSPSLSAGIGGGGSSYGGLGTLLGGISSLNANDKAQKDLLNAQSRSISQFQPYLDSGSASNKRLSELLGTGGDPNATDYGQLSKPFSPGDLTQDPGYQFRLQQGTDALNRSLGAKGQLFSGSALKASQEFGQGLADQTYKDAYDRYVQDQNNLYSKYANQSSQGQAAAGSASNIYDNIGNAKANAEISSSNILNNTLSSLLSGSGAKRLRYDPYGNPVYV